MKKLRYWMIGTGFTAVVAVVAMNVNLAYGGRNYDDLTLHNVEALAQGESGGGTWDCYGSGNVDCGGGKYYVRVSAPKPK